MILTPKRIALIGNPNSGKTVLFNQLTGHHQRIGNWSGVTVTSQEGQCVYQAQRLNIIDFPGTYTCSNTLNANAMDFQITCDALQSRAFDIILNVVNAAHLERGLYLTAQLCEMQLPLIVALNMMDVAEKNGLSIDIPALSKQLGCQVIPIIASQGKGIRSLQQAILDYKTLGTKTAAIPTLIEGNPKLQMATDRLITALQNVTAPHTPWHALSLLEGDAHDPLPQTVYDIVTEQRATLAQDSGQSMDTLIADLRYTRIRSILSTTQHTTSDAKQNTLSQHIDRIVLHRWLGIPIFFAVMYTLFTFTLEIGGLLQNAFDHISHAFFVQAMAEWLQGLHAPTWTVALIAHGIGRGINTIVTFIPVITILFLCLCVLEDSGYMARAAFVVDRGMQAMGLPGRAFIPMMIGFGCNVPAVMAARSLPSFRDRLLTTLMMPFMSCSARLAIYAIFVAAFFPNNGVYIVFSLYLIGIMAALGTGYLLRFAHFGGPSTPLVMELPDYHRPRLSTLLQHTWHRLQHFLSRAGKLIIPVCALISALNAVNIHGKLASQDTNTPSVLAWVGQQLTPTLGPIGINRENWPATVGLLTGVIAKEVVVGSLNTLYSQELPNMPLTHYKASTGAYDIMRRHFDGGVGAFAYLLFVLLYFPCVSTAAVMARELNNYWTGFSMLWSLGLAYGVAVFFYQTATFTHHPTSALAWMLGIGVTLFGFLVWLKKDRENHRTQAPGPNLSGAGRKSASAIAACGGICKRCPIPAR